MDSYRSTLRRAALIAGMGAIFGTSTVVAGTTVGGVFNLGVANSVSSSGAAVNSTRLTGAIDGDQLSLSNTSTSAVAKAIAAFSKSATTATARFQNTGGGPALSLIVASGKAPMLVSTGAARVTNLDADKLDGHDSTRFARVAPLAWHNVRPAVVSAPPGTFHCDPYPESPGACWVTWGNADGNGYADGFGVAAFAKDAFGMVHVRGVVSLGCPGASGACGASDTKAIFRLPAGYRPAAGAMFPSWSNGDRALIKVTAAGDVVAADTVNYGDFIAYISLDGITFPSAG
jgi:hypothetical protein